MFTIPAAVEGDTFLQLLFSALQNF